MNSQSQLEPHTPSAGWQAGISEADGLWRQLRLSVANLIAKSAGDGKTVHAHLPVLRPLVLLDPGLDNQLPALCPPSQPSAEMYGAVMADAVFRQGLVVLHHACCVDEALFAAMHSCMFSRNDLMSTLTPPNVRDQMSGQFPRIV
jgi:hypothetical protein